MFLDLLETSPDWSFLLKKVTERLAERPDLNNADFKEWTAVHLKEISSDYGEDSLAFAINRLKDSAVKRHLRSVFFADFVAPILLSE
jgi:hypothetical protein